MNLRCRTPEIRKRTRANQKRHLCPLPLPIRTVRIPLDFDSPMNISEHRKAIDKLDADIVKLLNERTQHVLEIGEIKMKAGEEIYAPHRERAVLQRIIKMNQGPITEESLRAIYREIMSSAL